MKKINKKLNIFDYVIIVILVAVVVYISILKVFSVNDKNSYVDIGVYLYCKDVPVISEDKFKTGDKICAGGEKISFGIIKEFKKENTDDKFIDVSFKAECKARKNNSGGYVIDGTTYYLGQDVKLFINSIIMNGCIYEIEDSA